MSFEATLIGLAGLLVVVVIMALGVIAINKWEDSHPVEH